MAGKTSKTSAKVARKAAAKRVAAKPNLLSGGNPQIAKGYGDAPVQAYIAAMPAGRARQDHIRGPAVLVRVSDRFTGAITHTSVCAKHYQSMSECKLDLMHMESWTMLGLA